MPKMENIKLPIENAQEPVEEASQPLAMKTTSPRAKSKKNHLNISFAESSECEDKPESQKSASYKDALSQPAAGLTQRQRLQWLQKRRSPGLWVQCDSCDRWRHLPYVVDSHELPHKWYCKMNPDSTQASCSTPELPIRLHEEEDLIHSEYSAGSVVWARLPGWPWWPAMVDDCPDNEQFYWLDGFSDIPVGNLIHSENYARKAVIWARLPGWPAMVDDCPDNEQFYWLDGFSDIPTHYNVVFFDTFDVTRAWVAPDQMKPYSANKKSLRSKDRKFKSRLEVAMKQAEDADLLPLSGRLAKYSFIARYKGTINKPKKINKKVLEKFKKQLKRKLNIEFSDDESSDEDFIEPKDPSKKNSNMNGNVIILGTPKRNKHNIVPKVLNKAYNKVQDIVNEEDCTDASVKDITAANTEKNKNNNLEPDSMTVQIGSSEIVQDAASTTLANETKETVIDSEKTEQYEVRIPSSASSDDFDF